LDRENASKLAAGADSKYVAASAHTNRIARAGDGSVHGLSPRSKRHA
jgi:hypothetical protein